MRVWYHWSSSGQLVSDPLHAGTRGQAERRRRDLDLIPWGASDLVPEVPEHWRQGEHSRMFALELTEDLLNPDEPVDDHEVYELVPYGPVLYVNGNEEPGEISVVAPLSCWRVLETRHPM